jgi:hypothetical protein
MVNMRASSAPVNAVEEGPVWEGVAEEGATTGVDGAIVVGVTVVGWVAGP